MAKISNLYEQIYDFENLYQAYLNARKNKRFRADVLKFSASLEENLIQIQNELMWHTYEVGRYKEFYVYDPKKRLIMALDFKDRVVQWAIYRQLNPLLDRRFIEDSFGCRIGKGTHRAADRLQYWLRQADRKPSRHYYLKLDIAKYFYRIDHEALIKILRKKIADEQLMQLLEKIINCDDVKFGIPIGIDADQCEKEDRLSEVGIPIGNLTSQMFANLYLNELDQYAKHTLKLHYYLRYMDDIIILHSDKNYLHEIKAIIENFLNDELHLQLNKKTAIRPISVGVEFVGFRIYPTHKKLKRKSLARVKKRVKQVLWQHTNGHISKEQLQCSLQSFKGLMKHFNSRGLRNKLNRIYMTFIKR